MRNQGNIPSRHGSDIPTARKSARMLRRQIREDPEPSSERWHALGAGLLQADAPMDRLLEWMHSSGMRSSRTLFEQALEQGVDAIPNAPEPLRHFFEGTVARPSWLDDDLLRTGAEVSQMTGMTGLYALRDAALMPGYRAAGINQTLVQTGTLESGPQRRLARTTKWWLECMQVGGMDRFGDGFRNTLRVRLAHSLVRRKLRQMDEWDSQTWGLPVNQTDMVATQLAFSVLFLAAVRYLGVPITHRESRAVMHLWRYIGWLMGVDERWLTDDEHSGRVLLYQILLTQAPPDESSWQLGRALMDEPMHRFYPGLTAIRGRYERARHLSINRLFLGGRGMRELGLPAYVPPWYPALSAPLNLLWHTTHRLTPAGRTRLIRRGRDAQLDYLKVLFGEERPGIRVSTVAVESSSHARE